MSKPAEHSRRTVRMRTGRSASQADHHLELHIRQVELQTEHRNDYLYAAARETAAIDKIAKALQTRPSLWQRIFGTAPQGTKP